MTERIDFLVAKCAFYEVQLNKLKLFFDSHDGFVELEIRMPTCDTIYERYHEYQEELMEITSYNEDYFGKLDIVQENYFAIVKKLKQVQNHQRAINVENMSEKSEQCAQQQSQYRPSINLPKNTLEISMENSTNGQLFEIVLFQIFTR